MTELERLKKLRDAADAYADAAAYDAARDAYRKELKAQNFVRL